MSEKTDRSHYLVTITYDYEQSNRKTRKILVLSSLTSQNAIQYAMKYVPYGQKIININSNDYRIPTYGSSAFEIVSK
ncbi:hypothetical protein LCGC14_2205030 [marine sediment metagenome]|uniref:Uncharacterized protein n=1 Tax=marine sediment metagenome TaxID=412755 RepID=A0A0F9DFG8_9ZZZZ